MREIKFRAWQEKSSLVYESKMYSWDELKGTDYTLGCFEYEGIVFMQFTGLKDKNGVEIYEGDIVKGQRITKAWGKRPEKTEYLIFEVYWDEEWRGFKVDYPKMKWSGYLGIDMPYEVIGNIYQNPELLK